MKNITIIIEEGINTVKEYKRLSIKSGRNLLRKLRKDYPVSHFVNANKAFLYHDEIDRDRTGYMDRVVVFFS